MKISGWLSGFVSLMSVSAASAATLTPLSGNVLLNQGAGYKPVAGTVDVKPGDSVLVNPGGSAQLTYGECASYEIKPGDVVFVAEDNSIPCTGAAAAGAGVGSSTLIIGGLAVAAGVGLVAGISSSSSSPASP